MTVGDIRKALEGFGDDETLHIVGLQSQADACAEPDDEGALVLWAPRDRVRIVECLSETERRLRALEAGVAFLEDAVGRRTPGSQRGTCEPEPLHTPCRQSEEELANWVSQAETLRELREYDAKKLDECQDIARKLWRFCLWYAPATAAWSNLKHECQSLPWIID